MNEQPSSFIATICRTRFQSNLSPI